jgi:hypothetical protein
VATPLYDVLRFVHGMFSISTAAIDSFDLTQNGTLPHGFKLPKRLFGVVPAKVPG